MISLKHRSEQLELLDGEDIPFGDIKRNMQELNFINTYLGGHDITVNGFKQIIVNAKLDRPLLVCEIGCGGGDNLAAINRYCQKHNIAIEFIGIDLNSSCIAFAKEQYPKLKAKWIVSDYKAVNLAVKPDIIFSSLFCHHFKNNDLIAMLQWKRENSKFGFFINDLERNYFAFYSIKTLTKLFSSSYLVKNDACLSVARGFKREEWRKLLASSKVDAAIKWKWAFRHLIIGKHG